MRDRDMAYWVDAAGAELHGGSLGALVGRVCTDSRKLRPGDLFVALIGEKFDAHDHLEEIWEKGAVGAVVSRESVAAPDGVALLRVPDTLSALQRMARTVRRDSGWKVIGVTGSSGKTSTKDMLRAVLKKVFVVEATPGNLNNHIGVPLTILGAEEKAEVLICEMGTNHHGEIAVLAAIAEPDMAVVTNIGTAHIEHLGSREGIAEEKGALAAAIPAGGFVILSANDDFCEAMAARTVATVVTAGIGRGDVVGRVLEAGQDWTRFLIGDVEATLPVAGEHMVRNALLAVAAGLSLGMSLDLVVAGLAELELTGGRLTRRVIGGVVFLDDSYNANPQSMKAALETLKSVPCAGKRVAMLGRMGELGDTEAAEHAALGLLAQSLNFDAVASVGAGADAITSAMSSGNRHHFPDQQAAAAWLKDYVNPEDLVLVKGSRISQMERVPQFFSSL